MKVFVNIILTQASIHLYVYLLSYLAKTELQSIKVIPDVLVENSTGVFRCEAKLGGTGRENITGHLPFMKLFFADNPGQDLKTVRRDTGNTLVKVSDQL